MQVSKTGKKKPPRAMTVQEMDNAYDTRNSSAYERRVRANANDIDIKRLEGRAATGDNFRTETSKEALRRLTASDRARSTPNVERREDGVVIGTARAKKK